MWGCRRRREAIRGFVQGDAAFRQSPGGSAGAGGPYGVILGSIPKRRSRKDAKAQTDPERGRITGLRHDVLVLKLPMVVVRVPIVVVKPEISVPKPDVLVVKVQVVVPQFEIVVVRPWVVVINSERSI